MRKRVRGKKATSLDVMVKDLEQRGMRVSVDEQNKRVSFFMSAELLATLSDSQLTSIMKLGVRVERAYEALGYVVDME